MKKRKKEKVPGTFFSVKRTVGPSPNLASDRRNDLHRQSMNRRREATEHDLTVKIHSSFIVTENRMRYTRVAEES